LSNQIVIGSGGLIGSSIIPREKIKSQNYHPASIDWNSLYFKDMSSLDSLILKMNKLQEMERVPINLIWAAGKSTPKSNSEKCNSEFNVTRFIIEKIIEKVAVNLIYISSGGSIFSSSDSIRLESSTPNPSSHYGELKIKTEFLLKEMFSGTSNGLSIIRLPNIYGERQDPKKNQGIINKLISLHSNEVFEVYVSPESRKNYVSTEDVGLFLRYLLENNKLPPQSPQILHFPNMNNVYSVYEIIEMVKSLKNINVKFDERGVMDSVILDSEIHGLYKNVLSSSLKHYIEKKLS
jgi:nucleoside-diphosphate-sugar epimerase